MSPSERSAGHQVGAVLGSAIHPRELMGLSRRCEELGYSELWLAEDYFFTGGVAGAATVLGATSHVPVGLSIVSSVARHPALLAMEMSTLGHQYPGRLPGRHLRYRRRWLRWYLAVRALPERPDLWWRRYARRVWLRRRDLHQGGLPDSGARLGVRSRLRWMR